MTVSLLEVENFRNIERVTLSPDEGLNIIFGQNAQGKTNIIEALWLFSGARSFRAGKDSEFVRFGAEFFRNRLTISSGGREHELKISSGAAKEVFVNGIKKPSTTHFSEIFKAVVFTPRHLMLVSSAPELRRRFLDTAVTALKPGYAKILNYYVKALRQRNNLLKEAYKNADLLDTIFLWDEELARYGAAIIKHRLNYVSHLRPEMERFFCGISAGQEQVELRYEGTISVSQASETADIAKNLKSALKKSLLEDRRSGFTAAGPHRDDLSFSINGQEAKLFASQGQQRSLALALKLSEGELLFKSTKERPVVLLDDVLSELDEQRQKFILECTSENQVFLTTCEMPLALKEKNGKLFRMKSGKMADKI